MEKGKNFFKKRIVNYRLLRPRFLLLVLFVLLIHPLKVNGENGKALETEDTVESPETATVELGRALRPSLETLLVDGDITGKINVTGQNIISESRTPGILKKSAEAQLSSGYFANVIWVATPKTTTFTLSSGNLDTDITSATFSKLNELGTKWEKDKLVYSGITKQKKSVTISYSELTTIIKEYGPGIYRINVNIKKEKGSQSSFAIVINPESITPKIEFSKNGELGTSTNFSVDPEDIRISSTHLMLKEPNKIQQEWVLTSKDGSGKKWTGETQEELTAQFKQLLKGSYDITLEVSAESQYGYQLQNSLTRSFKLTKDQIDYSQFIELGLNLKNGFLRQEKHYNPTDILFGYHIAEGVSDLTLSSVMGKIQMLHGESGSATLLYEGPLGDSQQQISLPENLARGTYEIIYSIEATTDSKDILKKNQTYTFDWIPIQPTLACDKVINPCNIAITPVFTDSNLADYDLKILCGEQTIYQLNGLTLDVSNLANLPATEKTCYSLSFTEKLGIHPETKEAVYTEELSHDFDEKKPCPTIEIDQIINPHTIKLVYDSDLESLTDEITCRWEILDKEGQTVIQQGTGDEIPEAVLTSLKSGNYKGKMYEEYTPYLTYANGSGFAVVDFEIRELKVSLATVPNLNFGEQRLSYADNRIKLAPERGLDAGLVVEDLSKGELEWSLSVKQESGFSQKEAPKDVEAYIELNGQSLSSPVTIYESFKDQASNLDLTAKLKNTSDTMDRTTGLIFPYSAMEFEETGEYATVLEWSLSQVPSSRTGGQ